MKIISKEQFDMLIDCAFKAAVGVAKTDKDGNVIGWEVMPNVPLLIFFLNKYWKKYGYWK